MLHAEDGSERGRDADRRGAADAKHLDRFPDLIDASAFEPADLGGKHCLVEQFQIAIHAADPFDG